MESFETKVDQNKIQSTFKVNAKSRFILYILTEQIKIVGEIGRGLSTH